MNRRSPSWPPACPYSDSMLTSLQGPAADSAGNLADGGSVAPRRRQRQLRSTRTTPEPRFTVPLAVKRALCGVPAFGYGVELHMFSDALVGATATALPAAISSPFMSACGARSAR